MNILGLKKSYCFPLIVAEIIAGYNATYEITEWVKTFKFHGVTDIHYFVTHELQIVHELCKNTMAMDVIHLKDINCYHWTYLCENCADWAVDLILANQNKISWYHLANNSNPRAFALVDEYVKTKTDAELIENEMNDMLSANPCAIHLLRSRPALLDTIYLMWNPNAENLITEFKLDINYCALAANPASWAAALLFTHGLTSPDIQPSLCSNPNLEITNYVVSHCNMIDTYGLSTNPSAIDYLKTHPEHVRITIYSNPAIFELTTSKDLLQVLLEV